MKKGKLIAAIAAACMAFAFAPLAGTADVKAAENGTGTGTFYHGIDVNNSKIFNTNDTICISTNSGLADPNYASLGFPSALSAKLAITGAQISDGNGVGYPVAVLEKDPLFDGCTTGKLLYTADGWRYWCSGGAVVGAGLYYIYDVGNSAFTADDVTVTAKDLPASGTATKGNFTVQVAVNGTNYTVSDYGFTDQALDVENGDATVGFNVGGALITKVVPEAAVPAIEGLAFLTDAEKNTFKGQLNGLGTDAEVKAVVDAAKTQAQANAAKIKNDAAAGIDSDAQAAMDAIDSLDNLTSAEKQDKKDEIKATADNAKNAIYNAASPAAVESAKQQGSADMALIQSKAEAMDGIAADAKAAKEAIDKLDNLTKAEKNVKKSEVDSAAAAAKNAVNAAADADGINNAVQNGQAAIAFAQAKAVAADGVMEAAKEAKKGIDALENLTSAEKAALKAGIDDEADDAKVAIDNAADEDAILAALGNAEAAFLDTLDDAAAQDFVNAYTMGKDGLYKEINSNNADQILAGKGPWAEMTDGQKAKANALIEAGTGGSVATYDDYVLACEKFVKEEADKFVKNYLTGEDGQMYKEATAKNYEQILSGKADWDKKSQAEKDAINAALMANGGKSYEELLKLSGEIKENSEGFIKKYLTAQDGQIYKEATRQNYQQILSGKEAWDKMSQVEKDAINAVLVANGGKTYEELLKTAQEIEKQIAAENAKKIAKTGDTAMAGLYLLLAAASLAGIAMTAKKKRYI